MGRRLMKTGQGLTVLFWVRPLGAQSWGGELENERNGSVDVPVFWFESPGPGGEANRREFQGRNALKSTTMR